MPSGSENGRGRRDGERGITIEGDKKGSKRKGDKRGKRCGNEKGRGNHCQPLSGVLCMSFCVCFCAFGKEDMGVVQNVMPVYSFEHVSLLERKKERKNT